MKLLLSIFGLMSVILLTCSCNSKLTKDEAKDLLLKELKLPIPYTKQLSEVRLEHSEELEKLFKEGLLVDPRNVQDNSSNTEGTSNGGFFVPQVSVTIGFPWDLTDKGKKYFVKGGIDPFKTLDGVYAPIVKLADLNVGEITNISEGVEFNDGNEKYKLTTIMFNLKSSEITPFGEILLDPSEKQSLTFSQSVSTYKGKNGWVLMNNQITEITAKP